MINLERTVDELCKRANITRKDLGEIAIADVLARGCAIDHRMRGHVPLRALRFNGKRQAVSGQRLFELLFAEYCAEFSGPVMKPGEERSRIAGGRRSGAY